MKISSSMTYIFRLFHVAFSLQPLILTKIKDLICSYMFNVVCCIKHKVNKHTKFNI